MSEQAQSPALVTLDMHATWGADLEGAFCPQCGWCYLTPAGALPVPCPQCCQANLAPLGESIAQVPYAHPPEMLVPFELDAGTLGQQVQYFAKGIPFRPGDLTPQNLHGRLRRVYLPMWMVDGEVNATWQAEAGYDYEVVSHQDKYADGRGWASQQVKETRIRWEARLGRLTRSYQNVVAPALEDDAALRQRLGEYRFEAARAYAAEALQGALIRLPDRDTASAWPDAVPGFRLTAMEECRQAAKAEHIRQFRWSPEYSHHNWTLLLLPLYATYYLDDDGQPQAVLVNGQSGRLSGARRASMKRAQTAALIILAIAAVLFMLGVGAGLVGMVVAPLLLVAAIGLGLALLVGPAALVPIVRVWQFNRAQPKTQPHATA